MDRSEGSSRASWANIEAPTHLPFRNISPFCHHLICLYLEKALKEQYNAGLAAAKAENGGQRARLYRVETLAAAGGLVGASDAIFNQPRPFVALKWDIVTHTGLSRRFLPWVRHQTCDVEFRRF